MKKLTGEGVKKEIASPDQVKARASKAESAMVRLGRVVNLSAIAAGVTIKAKMSSTPTTCTASETATARMIMNATDRAATGTPRAAATSSSTEANSNGR